MTTRTFNFACDNCGHKWIKDTPSDGEFAIEELKCPNCSKGFINMVEADEHS